MEAVLIAFTLAIIVGYLWNIVKLSRSKRFSGMDALRVLGIFIVPMGAVYGYID